MRTLILAVAVSMFSALPAHAAPGDCAALLKKVDEAGARSRDFKALFFVQRKDQKGQAVVREMLMYSHGSGQKLVFLLTKPKTEYGQGYLALDRNLFFYDPSVGRWERNTERDTLGGSTATRSDFDAPHWSDRFDATCEPDQMLGKTRTHRFTLKAKAGVDVPFPLVHLWVDAGNLLEVKRQDLSSSGKVLRTDFYTNWQKAPADGNHAAFWYPQLMSFFDETQDRIQTIVQAKGIDLKDLDDAVFTKAWLERASR